MVAGGKPNQSLALTHTHTRDEVVDGEELGFEELG